MSGTRGRRRSAVVGGLAQAACAVVAIAGLLAPSAAAEPRPPGISTATAGSELQSNSVQAVLDQLVASGGSGALALVHDGERTWRLTSGAARLDPHVDLFPDARFRIGSLTKTLVATVALQAVAEGQLALDDPVSRWVPGVVPGDTEITLRMLLNHTSGLFNYTSSPVFRSWVANTPTRATTPQDLIALATAEPSTFPPGQGWSYSNTGYLVAGLMIEAATDRPIERLIRERIMETLDLDSTTFPKRAPNIARYHAHGYVPPSLTGADYIDVTKLSPTLTWAAGAMISTADDVHRFYSALLGGDLLPPEMLQEMLDTVPVDVGYGYGLGIESQARACGTVWGHSGSIPGYRTMVYSDPRGERTALVMLSSQVDETLFFLIQESLETAVCAMLHVTPPQGEPGVRRPGVPDDFA